MKKETWIKIEAIMLIVWIITLGIFLYNVFGKGTKCLANPFTYGAGHLAELNNASLYCECTFSNEPTFLLKFSDTEKVSVVSKEVEIKKRNYEFEELNFTKFIISNQSISGELKE